jgi:FlgD Ig-like domain
MRRLCPIPRRNRASRGAWPLFILVLGMLHAGTPAVAAGLLSEGEVVVPGNGCLWKLGSSTPWLTSNAFQFAGDAMEDDQGRIVFLAQVPGRNENDIALYRADPTTGSLERLFYLPYQVAPGDTLPEDMSPFGFVHGSQSLHLETVYRMTINDTINNGIPQVGKETCYAFTSGVTQGVFGQQSPVELRWRPSRGTVEQGFDVTQAGTHGGPTMTRVGNDTYYGAFSSVYEAGPELDVQAHFQVGGTDFNARLQVMTSNELAYAGILDDTTIPNVTVTCGNITDADVPMVDGGFSVLAVGTLGSLNGSVYATSNEAYSGSPYEFNLAPRAPFLNPYICGYYGAVKFTGGTPSLVGDTLGTTSSGDTGDGSSVIANANGYILAVSPGSVGILGRNGAYTGRPVRWHAPSSSAAMAARGLAAAPGDTSLTALVVRADSMVRVMITAPDGRRLGLTATDSVANDFGSAGLVTSLGPGGWPRVLTILGPAAGDYEVDTFGSAAGEFGLNAYLAETSTGGVKSVTSGSTAAGETQRRILTVQSPLVLQWKGQLGVSERAAGPRFGFDAVGPNPTTGHLRFAWRAPESGDVRLEIFDLAGRRVATLARGVHPAGPSVATWSGRNDDGVRMPPGVYMARLAMGGSSAVRRVVLIR